MKKVKKNIIKIIVLLIILLFCKKVYAAEPQISINGESTVKAGETITLKVNISSEKEIGIISGKIEVAGNAENITVTGVNDWNLTFNKNTGVFNIYKAEGSKKEEIINIKYKASEKFTTGSVTLSDIKMTTIDYETKEIENIVKNITIQGNDTQEPEEPKTEKKLTEIKIKENPTKTEYVEGEEFDKSGLKVIAKYSDGSEKEITDYTYSLTEKLTTSDKKITISYTENGITKTTDIEIVVNEKKNEEDKAQEKNDEQKGQEDNKIYDKVDDEKKNDKKSGDNEILEIKAESIKSNSSEKDDTKSKENLPKTGKLVFIPLILIVSIISVNTYRKLKKYDGI